MECDIDTLGVRRSGTFARGEVFASTLWGTLVAEPIARATWRRLDEISSRWRSPREKFGFSSKGAGGGARLIAWARQT